MKIMKEGLQPTEPVSQTGEYAYTEQQINEMPEWMREGIQASQQATALEKTEQTVVITEVPLTSEQRAEMASNAAAREAERVAEPVKYGGYSGVRISQMPGAVGGPIRIDSTTNPRHGDPRVEKLS